MRFNKDKELFCTDQEGATWLPTGNPFDELLPINRDRHYGFPPRHPRHLPNVIDEPSVFDYRPQHQSACGLNFNEPGDDGAIFGPDWWRSDAIVTGYSRGKLYRTRLVKTASGYVAQNQLLASANMLLADACVAPSGALVLAAHSGGPDWGSGPSGKGKLYKITYEQPAIARRVEWCGAGETIPFTSLDASRVRNAITAVLQATSYRESAAEIGEAIARDGGVKIATSLIETAVNQYTAAV
jgi:hypothetical protein